MKRIWKCFAMLLTVILCVSVIPPAGFEAYTLPPHPSKPTFKVELIEDDTAVKITINKCENTSNFTIYYTGLVEYYKGYTVVYDSDMYPAYLNEDELKKRTCIIRSIAPGKHKIYIYASNKSFSTKSDTKEFTISDRNLGYKDSYDLSGLKKGDTFFFGSYEQDGDISNGRDPIEWIVFSKSKSTIFAVSKYVLERLPYTYSLGRKLPKDRTWKGSTLRKFLKEKFYNLAFNETEKGMIKTSKVYSANFEMTDGEGTYTKDKVFLPSVEDVTNPGYGFEEDTESLDKNRICHGTASCHDSYWEQEDDDFGETYWLTSPSPYRVNRYGKIEILHCSDDSYDSLFYVNGVRPAIRIRLK